MQCLNNRRIRRHWRSVSSSAGCNKYNLVLVARNAEKLRELHQILTDTYETNVKFFASHLSKTDTTRQLFEGMLATTALTINEIAFQLGFEQSRSLAICFKARPVLPLWPSGNYSIKSKDMNQLKNIITYLISPVSGESADLLAQCKN